MISKNEDELKRAVDNMHHCSAHLVQSVPIREKFERKVVWDGTATRAYAWSSPIEGSDKRRFFAVLHQPPVTSPLEAVRAAIIAEHRSK